MCRLIFAVALLIGFAPIVASATTTAPTATAIQVAAAQSLQLFYSPEAAQKTRSGIYHYAGQRWYGRTENGAYVCEKEAIAAGDRATRNGQ